MSFLSMGSIRNLIAYVQVNTPAPNVSPSTRLGPPRTTSGDLVQLRHKLRVQQNARSLSLRGDVDWIWEASKDELRKAVSKMRLVRLEVPVLLDPHARQHGTIYDGWEYLRRNSHVDLGANVRRLLQAQPHLEEFKFSDSVEDITSRSVASLRACLQASDIPNLKSLKAPPEVAMVSLPLASRLESLDLMTADWDDRLLSEIETKAIAIKLCTRRFVIRVSNFYHDQWFWNNLNNVFTLFPNLEYLSITVNSMTTAHRVGPARFWVAASTERLSIDTRTDMAMAEVHFEAIANDIHVLSSLREIEVWYETLSGNKQIHKIKTQTVADFKTACPLLETVVDPEGRLWTFRPGRQSSGLFVPFLVGSSVQRRRWPKDLPAPQKATRTVD